MKKILLFVILNSQFLTPNSFGQSPNWFWAKNAGGMDSDRGESIATDTNGNVYVTGYFFSSSITFGSITLTNTNFHSDIFLVKYDGSGNVLWAKSAGGTYDDRGCGLATDTNGNVYVTGYFFSSSITFGSITLTNTSVLHSDIFTVKYDASGNVLWAKSAGGTNDDGESSIATDASGNIYATGFFYSPSITFGSTTLTNASAVSDIFTVKYDGSGNVLWAKSAGGTGGEFGHSIATDAGGNIYLTGSFYSLSITFDTTSLTNAGGNDIFIVKYDGSGNVLWAKSAGGADNDDEHSIATDLSGNVYATGSFQSASITFGSTTLTNANPNFPDIFTLKYDGSGNVLWAKSAGGTSYDVGFGTATDRSGNVYVTGSFVSPTITFGLSTLTNAGDDDIFTVKYDGNGNVLWAKSAGGTKVDVGLSITTDTSGNVYITGGFFSSSLTFGSTTLTNANPSDYDIFVAKLNGVTGVEDASASYNMQVYPNPTHGVINISLNKNIKQGEVSLYNMLGDKIYSSPFNPLQGSISVQLNAPQGVYFVQLRDEKKLYTQKIIIQ